MEKIKKKLTNHPAHDGHPNFSPDRKRIVFHSNRIMPSDTYKEDAFTDEVNQEIYEMDLDGNYIKQITDYSGWDTYPDILPDGKKIAFRRRIPTEIGRRKGNSEVFVDNIDGSEAYNLSNYPEHDGWPSWSPDGQKIAFATERERADNWQIYIINLDGTRLTRLTEFDAQGAEFAKPQWSPDGKK